LGALNNEIIKNSPEEMKIECDYLADKYVGDF